MQMCNEIHCDATKFELEFGGKRRCATKLLTLLNLDQSSDLKTQMCNEMQIGTRVEFTDFGGKRRRATKYLAKNADVQQKYLRPEILN
jgi:antitoxin component of MazEF toxin-antitoxin module